MKRTARVAAPALARACAFLSAAGAANERVRAAALAPAADASWCDPWWRTQRRDGALALSDLPDVFASTLYVVASLDDVGALRGDRVARALAWLGAQQDDDGGWPLRGEDTSARIAMSAFVAGYLAKTPYVRPAVLRRAGGFVASTWSPDRVRSGHFDSIAGFAHFFANAPHELADGALQWCGRELERAYRGARLSVEQVVRIFTLCGADAFPGTRIRWAALLEELRGRQAEDGGWLPEATPAARCAATWAAAIALRRGGAPFAGTGAPRHASTLPAASAAQRRRDV